MKKMNKLKAIAVLLLYVLCIVVIVLHLKGKVNFTEEKPEMPEFSVPTLNIPGPLPEK